MTTAEDPKENIQIDTESQTEEEVTSHEGNDSSSDSGGGCDSFAQRQAKRMARNPCKHLWIAMILAIALSAIALIVGEFQVSANTGGWQSKYSCSCISCLTI